MQQFRVSQLPLRLCMAAGTALVALTAGVATLCFVRLVGLMVLGRPRTTDPALPAGSDRGLVRRVPVVGLGLACYGLAAVGPWTVRYLAAGLAPIVSPAVTQGALKSPWVLQPVFHGFSILSPSWLFVAFPVAIVSVAAVATLLSRGRLWKIRRVPPWHSASAGVGGADSYTPFGYANPLRHVLANVLGTRKSLIPTPTPVPPGTDPRAVVYAAGSAVVEFSKRLQSGRLGAYVGYMLVALLAVLVVAAALR
ncbi:MAG: proton-conducting transporter membrane subunit, partial [Acidimicrobiales bacterium]